MRNRIALIAALCLSACSTGVDKLPGVNAPSSTQRPAYPPPQRYTPPPAQAQAPGLEGILGARASALIQRLGPARLDLIEGRARKLQFLGSACVLDIFLYPPSAGGEPVATHIAARKRSDGAQFDERQCLSEVESGPR